MASTDEGKNPEMHGEGNAEADKNYREAATEYAESGEVKDAAKKAERDLAADPATYAKAVEEGKKPSRGDLRRDLKKK